MCVMSMCVVYTYTSFSTYRFLCFTFTDPQLVITTGPGLSLPPEMMRITSNECCMLFGYAHGHNAA